MKMPLNGFEPRGLAASHAGNRPSLWWVASGSYFASDVICKDPRDAVGPKSRGSSSPSDFREVWNPYVERVPIFRLKGHTHALCGVSIVPNTPQVLSADAPCLLKALQQWLRWPAPSACGI